MGKGHIYPYRTVRVSFKHIATSRCEVNLFFYVTIDDISVIYVTAHKCAGGLKKFDQRWGSQRHRHFVGFISSLRCPSKHRHGATLFIRLFRETAPFSRLLRHAVDTEDTFSTYPPPPSPGPHGGISTWKHKISYLARPRLDHLAPQSKSSTTIPHLLFALES